MLLCPSIPEEILAVLRVEQMTALQKPNGGVRSIVVGDVIRRLVAKTVAKQFMTTFGQQPSLSSALWQGRAGQGPRASRTQCKSSLMIDRVGAFDLIRRRAMMCAVQRMLHGEKSLHSSSNFTDTLPPFEGKRRKVLFIRQGEGGERGKSLDFGLVRPGSTSTYNHPKR